MNPSKTDFLRGEQGQVRYKTSQQFVTGGQGKIGTGIWKGLILRCDEGKYKSTEHVELQMQYPVTCSAELHVLCVVEHVERHRSAKFDDLKWQEWGIERACLIRTMGKIDLIKNFLIQQELIIIAVSSEDCPYCLQGAFLNEQSMQK